MEKQIIEYICAGAPAISKMIEQVNLFIKHGFQPFGNMIVNEATDANGEKDTWYYQPMVKYGEPGMVLVDDSTHPYVWDKPGKN